MNPRTPTLPGAWPRERVLLVLANRVARAAISGHPTPVAARVLARLEASNA